MKTWFENLKISKKLVIGFFFVTVLGIIIGIVGIANLINIAKHQQETYDQCTLGISYSAKAEAGFLKVRTSVRDLYTYYHTDKEQYCEEISNQLDTIDTQMNNYTKTIANSEDQSNFDETKNTYNSYKKIINQILNAAESGKTDSEILTLIQNSKDEAQKTADVFDNIVNYNNSLASETLDSDRTASWAAIIIMIIVIILSFILSLLLSSYISKLISQPIHKFADFAEMLAIGDMNIEKIRNEKDKLIALRKDEIGILAVSFNKVVSSTMELAKETQIIADGDLTTKVTIRSEFDVLGKALGMLVDKFNSLTACVVTSADQVDSSANLVADSSTALSQGATEQASSVEELSASLEQITTKTADNAKSAQTTDQLGKNIKDDAEASNIHMREMLSAMDEINTSSNNISKIIKVIEDIAFQTNILALNAAVEAARAGKYGSGFAVVAEEVRSLAAQSAKAAKETTDLIENSIKKVDTGTKIAKETANSLEKIVEGISKATEHINAIATSSNEQAAGLEQINQGIMQVSQVVQNNAAAAEECAAASEELSSQADNLKNCLSVFKLNSDNTFTPGCIDN